jgi:hypothetical protein
MAYNVSKTEHSGAKNGAGAFYGRREFAKKGSSKVRRMIAAKDKREELASPQ